MAVHILPRSTCTQHAPHLHLACTKAIHWLGERWWEWNAGKAGQHGELLFSILLEFWLTDGEDPSLKDPKDSRLAPPLPYEAPTTQLLEAMQVPCALLIDPCFCPVPFALLANELSRHVSTPTHRWPPFCVGLG